MIMCPEWEYRNSLSDEDFWAYVTNNGNDIPEEGESEVDLDTIKDALDMPCPVCRSTGACGYDSEGRPMIHTVEDNEDDTD